VGVFEGVGVRRGGLDVFEGVVVGPTPLPPPPPPVEVAVAVGVEVGDLVAVDVGEAVGEGVFVGDVVTDGVGVGVEVGPPPTTQPGRVIVFVSRVTAPLRASTRPDTLALVWTLIEVRARMLPTKFVPVPRVAELPTCQNTLQAWAPLMSATVLFDAVINVEPAWKTNTASGSPCALRVTVPVSAMPAASL
jgi:hypothetical protein